MTLATCITVDWLRHDADGTLRFGPLLNGVLRREASPAVRAEIAGAYLAFAERQLKSLSCARGKQSCDDTKARSLAMHFYQAIEQCARETAEQ
jgi:hypothetical protein